MTGKKVKFIGAAQGWGTGQSGTQHGPAAFSEFLGEKGATGIKFEEILSPETEAPEGPKQHQAALPYVTKLNRQLCEATFQVIRNREFPVVFGGDHSIAVGTWSGIIPAFRLQKHFGLIWIDAHLDANTPETAAEGKWGGHLHGQSLAALLGHGEEELVGLLPEELKKALPIKLDPQHVFIIGARSCDPGETRLLEKLGVRIYHIDEVNQRGFESCFKESLSEIRKNTKGYGLSIDLDAFDPEDAPAVGTPEENGIRAEKVIECMHHVNGDPRLVGLEVVEYCPQNDSPDRQTAALALSLINAIVR